MSLVMRNLIKDVKGLSLLLLFGCCLADQLWRCTSAHSKYSEEYCRDNGPTKGCYFLENFKQYRPCANICNNATPSSEFEDQCNASCEGYLTDYGSCTLTEITTTLEVTTSNVTAVNASNSREQSLPKWAPVLFGSLVVIIIGIEQSLLKRAQAVIGVLVVIIIGLLLAIILLVYLWKKKKCCFQEDDRQSNIPMGELTNRGTASGNSSAPSGEMATENHSASRNEERTSNVGTPQDGRPAERVNEIDARNSCSPQNVNAIEGATAGVEPTHPPSIPVQKYGNDENCRGSNDCRLTPTEEPTPSQLLTQTGEHAPLLENHGSSGEADDSVVREV